MSKKSIVFLILAILWMGVIFLMSNSSGEESGNMSEDIVVFVVDKFDKITNASKEIISYHHSREFLDNANFIFRKFCHFSEYFILGILLFAFLFTLNKYSVLRCSIYAGMLSILYAIFDEYHQTFINGRAGQLMDVLIDSFGVLVSIILAILIIRRKRDKCFKKLDKHLQL